ncbi:hypothetical protein [Streptacidiphilus neutrinimicus]|uniref:hypothetical protein n=1 Tax=Streptacidiphilus neutrinimicus TaxID=105420 RepID=UPI0005A81EB9|nr:hypothetical protein [Streptacidiphilus neutrinimicus]
MTTQATTDVDETFWDLVLSDPDLLDAALHDALTDPDTDQPASPPVPATSLRPMATATARPTPVPGPGRRGSAIGHTRFTAASRRGSGDGSTHRRTPEGRCGSGQPE